MGFDRRFTDLIEIELPIIQAPMGGPTSLPAGPCGHRESLDPRSRTNEPAGPGVSRRRKRLGSVAGAGRTRWSGRFLACGERPIRSNVPRDPGTAADENACRGSSPLDETAWRDSRGYHLIGSTNRYRKALPELESA